MLLEPFFLIKKYNSPSTEKIHSIKFGPNGTTFLMQTDDNLFRIIPVFPSSNFRTQYELKGHKNRVVDFKDDLELNNKLLTMDL